jgi:predicted amidohydrolase
VGVGLLLAILALPADLGSESAALMPSLLRARAFENGCAIAFANRADHPASMIIGPDGDVLAESLRGLAVADVSTTRPAEAARRLAARRPLLYQRLTSSHPPDEALRL